VFLTLSGDSDLTLDDVSSVTGYGNGDSNVLIGVNAEISRFDLAS
jgi:hypothetical protein